MTVTTLRPQEPTGVDSSIYSGKADANCGGALTIDAGTYLGGIYRGQICFDLSDITEGATITSAILTLACTWEGSTADLGVALHRALTQWYEGSGTETTPDPGENASTWNHRNHNGSVDWGGGHTGGQSGTDYAAVATATTTITAAGGALFDWDVTADVQSWVNGTADNYGWFLINADESSANTDKSFPSSRAIDEAKRPVLVVTWSEPPANQAPTAVISAPDSAHAGAQVDVDGTGSSDPDGTIESYDWDWGDETAHGSGSTASHTYNTPDTYTITLTVEDDDGATDQDTHQIEIEAANQAPTADVDGPATGNTGAAVVFDGSGSSDPDGTIVSYDWNWGDGTAHGSGVTASHQYAAYGTYTVTLTVTDDDGATDQDTAQIAVDAVPIAIIDAPSTGNPTVPITFDGSDSYDPDGSIVAYDWDFGDNTPHSSAVSVNHTYALEGSYVVTLTVTDDDGYTGTDTQGMIIGTLPGPAVRGRPEVFDFVLRDVNGVKRGGFNDVLSFVYVEEVNHPGSFQITLAGNHRLAKQFTLNAQVEIWRENEAMGLGRYLAFVGLCQYQKRERPDKHEVLTIKGPGTMGWLAGRTVAWAAGTANRSTFDGAQAETIMKTLVDYNIGPNATEANGRLEEGAMAGLSVETDGAGGAAVSWQCANDNLLTSLQNLAAIANGDFNLVRLTPTTYQFRFYSGQLGTDRSATVIFSTDRGTMKSPAWEYDRTSEATVAIVAGAGTGAAREVAVRYGTDYNATTNNVQTFVDARDVGAGDTAGLNAKGDKALQDRRAKQKFTFDVQQQANCYYGVHYVLGDLAKAIYNADISATVKIQRVTVSKDKKGQTTIKVETERVWPDPLVQEVVDLRQRVDYLMRLEG